MTPLAASLSKQLTMKRQDRDPHFWGPNLSRLKDALFDTHFFEFSEIFPLLSEIENSLTDKFGVKARVEDVTQEEEDFLGSLSFLPAPKTWLEWKHPVAGRMAFLLEELDGAKACRMTLFWNEAACYFGRLSLVSSDYVREANLYVPKCFEHWTAPSPRFRTGGVAIDAVDALISLPHLVLMAINSPRILGRRQIMPNRGLERRLAKQLGAGAFPLRSWTELKLVVAKPIEIDDGEPHEAHLTGKRALHFCRKHIRIRGGRMEYVRAHWRGDPSIGIKQTRYRVTA